MFKTILVPVDIAHKSSWQFAIPEALEIAGASGGVVAIMTVVQAMKLVLDGVAVPFEMEQLMADAERRLASIVSEFAGKGRAIERDVRFGLVGPEILTAARDRGADLILMASHRPEMRDYLIGPNAAHVARHATCSVLVLRKLEGR